MSTITTKDGVEIFYKDWGQGQPIVFHHGWPLSCDDWDSQMLFFVQHGYRVIGIDRRGHGRSSQVSDGHDMDHYAADAAGLRTTCDDKPVAALLSRCHQQRRKQGRYCRISFATPRSTGARDCHHWRSTK